MRKLLCLTVALSLIILGFGACTTDPVEGAADTVTRANGNDGYDFDTPGIKLRINHIPNRGEVNLWVDIVTDQPYSSVDFYFRGHFIGSLPYNPLGGYPNFYCFTYKTSDPNGVYAAYAGNLQDHVTYNWGSGNGNQGGNGDDIVDP